MDTVATYVVHAHLLVVFFDDMKKSASEQLSVIASQLAAFRDSAQRTAALAEAIRGSISANMSRLSAALQDNPSLLADAALAGLPKLMAGFDAITGQDEIGGIDLAVSITKKSRKTIYNLVSLGKIPANKADGKLYFSRNALLAYIGQPRPSFALTGFSPEQIQKQVQDNPIGPLLFP